MAYCRFNLDFLISVTLFGGVGMKNNQEHHIIPFSILRNVAVALLILTVITVATAQLKLGVLAAPIAFLIAFVKAMLVMMYFMGLKYDEKLNRMIFATGFIFLALLFAFSAIDIWTRIAQQSPL